MDKDNPLYYTSDLGISAYLVTLGYRIATFDAANTNRIKFGFAQGESLEEDVTKYSAGMARVDPSLFYNNIKNLKLRVMGARENQP